VGDYMDVITNFPTYFVADLDSINYLYAGIVAVIFGLLARKTLGVILLPVVAAVIYLAAVMYVPLLLNGGAITMPALDKGLLERLISFYVVFLVADLVVFIIKKLIQKIF
jgi:hypothetical protein